MDNKVKVIINGVQYTLVSAETEQYISGVGSIVDAKMREIIDSGAHVSALMAAVLTAVNFCDENKKLEQDIDNLRGQLKNYIDDVNKMRAQYMEAAKEANRLQSELQNARVQMAKEKQKI